MAVLLILMSLAACGVAGQYVSTSKHRPEREGLALGLVFGPVGLIVAALLPTLAPPTDDELAARKAERLDRMAEEAAERKARRAALKAADAQLKAALTAGWTAGSIASLRALAALGRSLGRGIRWVVTFGWFRGLPDWLQAVAAGLVVGGSLVYALVFLLS